MKKTTTLRICAATVGTFMLTGVASAAFADDEQGNGDVAVHVEVAEIDTPGVLAMSVSGTSTTLTENGSTELTRQFTGTLPTVTVTDTRAADDIPAGAGWYVLGTATDFVGADNAQTIGADHLGWRPALVDGGDSGLVAEGDPVESALDDGAGLVDKELLVSTWGSADVQTEGQWSATASLFLRAPADVTPGSYTSTLTLSLFE